MTSRSFRKDAVLYMRLYATRGHIPRSNFLRAISHSLGAHTAAFDVVLDASDAEDDDQQQQQQQQPTQQDGNRASTSALNDTQSDDACEVSLIAARTGVALVCGHSRFCASCADTVAAMVSGCPIIMPCSNTDAWFFAYSIIRKNSQHCQLLTIGCFYDKILRETEKHFWSITVCIVFTPIFASFWFYCHFVLHFPVLHFPVLHFQRPPAPYCLLVV